MIERRINQRNICSFQIFYSQYGSSLQRGTAVNVSLSGIKIICPCKLLQGDDIDFEISLPISGKLLEGRGEVIWSERTGFAGYCAGIKFTDISDDDAKLLINESSTDSHHGF